MLIDHLTPVVAGVAGPGSQGIGVAVLAGIGIPVTHREAMRQVELRRAPGGGVVAGSAVGAEQALVIGRIGVAGVTLRRESLVHIVYMARGAFNRGMRPIQREARQ